MRSPVILVVDDEPGVRDLLFDALSMLGYEVCKAGSGAEALEMLDSPARVDLLLTDVAMPEMSGPALARTARERKPGIKVLYMSGYDQGPLPHSDGFLSKPFILEELKGKVKEVLEPT